MVEKYKPPLDIDTISSKPPVVTYNKLEVVNTHSSPQDMWLGLARTAVGEGYVPYYHKYIRTSQRRTKKGESFIPVTKSKYVNEVAMLMYDDPYGTSERSETICVFDQSTENGKKLAGTARLVFGEEYPTQVLRPLELIELVQPENGWDAILRNKSLDKVCELGRVVIPEEYRGVNAKGENQSTVITQKLIDGENGVVQVAQEHDREIVLMVAQEKFAVHAQATSLDFGEGIPIELLPAARSVANVFPKYWRNKGDTPHLYVAQVPPKAA
jgi:hypothetical protein